jgi:hypothetical protein
VTVIKVGCALPTLPEQSDNALAAMVVSERADQIELDNGTVIMVNTSAFRSVRGLSLAVVICDEVAFWDHKASHPIPKSFER